MATLLGVDNFNNGHRLEFQASNNQAVAKPFQLDPKLGTHPLSDLSIQPACGHEALHFTFRSIVDNFLRNHQTSIDPEKVSSRSPQESDSQMRNLSITTLTPSSSENSHFAIPPTSSGTTPLEATASSNSQLSIRELQTLLVQYKVFAEEIKSITQKPPPAELQPLLADDLFQQFLSLDKTPVLDPHLLDLRDSEGYNLLMKSISLKNEQKFQEVLPFYLKKNELFSIDSHGRSALHHAAALGHDLFINALIEAGLGINEKDHTGLTPLHWAIHERRIGATDILVKKGASLEETWSYQGEQFNSIEMVVAVGDNELLNLLIDHDRFKQLDLTRFIPGVGNLLHLAIRANQSPMLKHLLSFYFDRFKPLLNQRDFQGRTPLQLAAFLGDLNAIRQLHDRGVDLNYGNGQKGGTAFHYAALGEQPDVIRLLDWLGATLTSCQDNDSIPPLHLLENKQGPLAKECESLLTRLPRMARTEKTEPPNFIKRPPFNLVIPGGAPRGIAYLGVIQTMEKLQTLSMLKRVAGTSSGAITATFLAVGCDIKELEMLLEKNLEDFLDAADLRVSGLLKSTQNGSYQDVIKTILKDYWKGSPAYLDPNKRAQALQDKLQHHEGIASGEKLREWIEGIIVKNTMIPHCTFKELKSLTDKDPQKYKELHAFSLQVLEDSKPQTVRFTHENPLWENLIISDAIRASVSIPGVFQPHILYFKDVEGNRYPRKDLGKFIDSGLSCNLPIDAFDDEKYQEDRFVRGEKTNRRTLSLSLLDLAPNAKEELQDPSSHVELAKALMRAYYNAERILLYEKEYPKDRTIVIPIEDIGLIDSNIDEKAKANMIELGGKTAESFFGNHSLSSPFSHLNDKEKRVFSRQENVLPSIPWRYEVFASAQNAKDHQKSLNPPKFFDLPLPDRDFTGRKEELEMLHDLCTKNHRVAIMGLGGVGKTALSIKYANVDDYQKSYTSIHFIRAATPLEIAEGFSKLADQWDIPPGEPTKRLNKLKEKLDQCQKSYLIILDGVDSNRALESLEKHLPERGKCFLLTTRRQAKTRRLKFTPLELSSFNLNEATNYPIQARSHDDKEQAALLAKKFGCLPLALSHAVAYIRMQDISFRKYIELFEANQLELFTSETLYLDEAESQKTLLTTWQTSLDIIERDHQCPLAKEVISFFSFLGQSPIPFDLVKSWAKAIQPSLSEIQLRKALGYLKDYSLINSSQNSCYRIHHLVQEVNRHMLGRAEARTNALFQAIKGTASFFKGHDMENGGKRIDFREWTPHIEAILEHEEKLLPKELKKKLFPEIITLVDQIWSIYHWDQRHEEADAMFHKKLALWERTHSDRK